MKMKLAQRLLVKYYITQFNALALVSPRKAAQKAFQLFCTPLPVKKIKYPPPVFSAAEKLTFQHEGNPVRGYRWRPENSNGKQALVLHGFSSQVFKFEHFVQPLLHAGYTVYMFDAPAHGISGGKRIDVLLYKRLLLALDKQFGTFHAVLGHSLGALAATLAFEELPAQEERKLVLIAPASETERAIKNFLHIIDVKPIVKAHFRKVIEEIAGRSIDYFSVNRAVRNIRSQILWVHDKHDYICPVKDIRPTLENTPPHVHMHMTEHLGHNRVYKDPEVVGTIVRFLAS